ncbi:MAG: tetratricopeptide repeat protein [bacterium]
MDQARDWKSKVDNSFLFIVLFTSPLLVIHSLGGSAQFGAARQLALAALASMWAVAAIAMRGARGVTLPARGGVVFIIFISWVAAAEYFARPIGGETQRWMYYALLFLIYILASNAPDRIRARRTAEFAVIAAGIIVSVYGYLHFFRIYRIAQSVDWGQRTASLFEDPNYFGIYIIFPLYWALSKALTSGGAARWLRLAAAAVCVTGLFLSNSRSAWFSFGVSLPVFAAAIAMQAGDRIEAKNRMKLIACFIILIITSGLLVGRLPSMKRFQFDPVSRINSAIGFFKSENQVRTNIHAVAIRMIHERPIFGEGNFAVESQRVQADMYHERDFKMMYMKQPQHAYNDYFTIASVSGLPALFFYIVLLMIAFFVLWKNVGSSRGQKASCASGYIAAAFAFVIQGVGFQSPMLCVVAAAHFWATVGLAAPGPGVQAASETGHRGAIAWRRVSVALPAAVALCFFVLFFGIAPALGQYNYYRAFFCRNSGCYEEGMKYIDTAIKWMPANQYARAVKAEIALKSGDSDKAIEYYLEAKQFAPYDTLLLQSVGKCYAQRGEWDKAIAEFNEAIRWEPGQPVGILPYLAATYLGAGDKARAVKILNDGIEKHPMNPELHYALAGVYLAVGRVNEALIEANASVDLEPTNPVRYVRLAQALIAVGRTREARNILAEALEYDPNNEYVRRFFIALSQAAR